MKNLAMDNFNGKQFYREIGKLDFRWCGKFFSKLEKFNVNVYLKIVAKRGKGKNYRIWLKWEQALSGKDFSPEILWMKKLDSTKNYERVYLDSCVCLIRKKHF